MAVYYTVLIALVTVAAVFVLNRGAGETPMPAIAGGYDVTEGGKCLGEAFNLEQSGQFVKVSNTGNTVGGNLKFNEDDELTGSVSCTDGGNAELDAKVSDGKLEGTLGEVPVTAEFKRDPPAPGTPAPRAPGSVAGEYKVSPPSSCFGSALELEESDSHVEVISGENEIGTLEYDRSGGGKLTGELECADGATQLVAGAANDRTIYLITSPDVAAEIGKPLPEGAERVTATKSREFIKGIEALLLAVVVVMLFARLVGSLMPRIGQPRVMGEVLAGIMLGPTLLGAVAPDIQNAIFPSDIIPYLGVVANLGLIFYMFLVGLELDLSQLKGRIGQTLAISNTGVAFPMILGLLVALPTYLLVAPDAPFAGFALFMGVSMSITAFPVLARIIVERRMLQRPLGVLALSAAAIDDVTAWVLIALASSVAVAGSAGDKVIRTIALTVAFCLVMGLLTRRVLARAAVAYDEAGRVPGAWITAIFAGVLVCAFATEAIGVALIFGAFVMGLVMPRHAGLTEDVTHRVEDFVVILLLPMFFAYTGLKTDMLALGQSELLILTGVLCVVAVVGKFGGTMIAAKVARMGWRESAILATLMNTRGLTELIVLNLALEKGVISPALFSALVLMALVTTFMAGPLLRVLDRKGEFGAPVGEELEEARKENDAHSPLPTPDRSILLAPQTEEAVAQLRVLAEPLARSEPPRELILTRLIEPTRGAGVRGGLQTETRILAEAGDELNEIRTELIAEGVAARTAVFTSVEPGRDLVKLTEREAVDLLMLDGRRPLLGGGLPRGQVGTVLEQAPCDVAVLVSNQKTVVTPGPDAPVIVPFGGAQHDWAALELGAWIAATTGAKLQLLGRGDVEGEGDDASRLLANASLLVQRFVGIAAEPLIAEAGREGVLEASTGAGLLAIGLSENWRTEGLGETRSAIASKAPAPILFVRRGVKSSVLAPSDDVTRFSWSSAGISVGGKAQPA